MKRLKKEVVPQVKKIINKLNGDMVVLITSSMYGAGKSTLSIMLAKSIWGSFSFRQGMSYSVIDFLKMLRNKKMKVVIQDEGKRLGKRTDFMQRDVKYIENVLSEGRKLNKCVIINVGEMHRIFKWLANDKALIWIHIFKRGKFLLFQARNHIMEGNKFGLSKKTTEGVKNEAQLLRRLITLPSFCFMDTFPQFSELFTAEEYSEYEAMAEGETLEMIDDIIEELEAEQTQQKQKLLDDNTIAAEIITRSDSFLKTYGKRTFVDTAKIMAEWDCGYTKARKVKKIAELQLQQMGIL